MTLNIMSYTMYTTVYSELKGVLPWKPTIYSQPMNINSKKYPLSESLPRKK